MINLKYLIHFFSGRTFIFNINLRLGICLIRQLQINSNFELYWIFLIYILNILNTFKVEVDLFLFLAVRLVGSQFPEPWVHLSESPQS